MFHTSKLRLLVLVILAITSTAGIAQDSPTPVTTAPSGGLNDFIRKPLFLDVQLSPDGKYIAAIMPNDENPHENYLIIFDGQTGKTDNVIQSGHKALISSYFWFNNHRVVASLAIQLDGFDTPAPTGELFGIDADGKHQTDLFGFRAGRNGIFIRGSNARSAYAFPISKRPISDNQILIAVNQAERGSGGAFTEIDKLDVNTGNTTSLSTSPVRNAELMADHTGHVRVATHSNNGGFQSSLWIRASNDSDWVLANDSDESHVGMRPIGFNRDNSKLYVDVEQANGPDAVELFDMSTRKLSMVFQGKFADHGALLATADGSDYYAVIARDGIPTLHYLDETSLESRMNRALADNFPGQLVYFSSFTHDGKHAIVHVSSDRDPGDYYLFDMDSHHAVHLFLSMPWLDPKTLHAMQPIALQARDGLPLHGFLTLPSGNKPYPLIILPHGGPHGIYDKWGYDREAQLFSSQGYAVLQINYRGSGGYGSHFMAIGAGHWGTTMQDDLTDATKWAIQQGYTDPQHVCIYGGSYGGYAALEGAVREPDLYKCAIGYAGVYDLRVQLSQSDTRRSDQGEAYMHLALGTDSADLLQRSPLGGVDRIKASVLLLHGGKDPRVPYDNFREFTRALDKHGAHYESLVEPDEGHGFFLPQHQLEAYQKMLDFLDKNIGPASVASSTAPKSNATP